MTRSRSSTDLFAPGLVAPLALAFLLGATGCRGTARLAESDAATVLTHQVLEAPNPAEPGPFPVRTLFYGRGDDKNRPEYRDSVSVRTESVDGSKLVSFDRSRREYWGFDADSLPLNARVWYPEGAGPFPLALIVHGNHSMTDFSDPGYDYLGELLASRGFILASVDENFINGGIREENDARGWLLLEHLRAWREFDADPENPLYGKVDLGRIALMGHSRGGEAVAHAAAFNRLRRYPDDASLTFDFGFDIRSIVSIAPVDGQYLPTERLVPVRDVNYLVFHGSHDGDVTSFHGLRLWGRVEFTEPVDRFKAAVYVYRANHGQWNTVWGAHDRGPRSGRSLDLEALMPGEDQREFARIYISAFLEATLRDDTRYLPIFRDHRVIGEWLPETMYITRFETSDFRPVADFEEDIDVTTGAVPGVKLRGDSLSTWAEEDLELRSANRATTSSSQVNQVLRLGWNNEVRGQEEPGPAARYVVRLPAPLARGWGLGPEASLHFAMAPTNRRPGPRRPPADADSTGADPGAPGRAAGGGARQEGRGEPDEEEPIDISVEIVDARGVRASVPLSRYGPVRRPLETWILRRKDREPDSFATLYELVLQSYAIPLSDFTREDAGLDLSSIREVAFVFDRTSAGEVLLDDIGFARLDPAWWGARVPGG